MNDFNIYVFFPLLVGVILLFIEYGIVIPSQTKGSFINSTKTDRTPSDSVSNKISSLWNNFLLSKTVLAKTTLVYLKFILYLIGFVIILTSGGFVVYFIGSMLDGTFETALTYVSVYSPITVSFLLVIGIAQIWAAVRLSNVKGYTYSSLTSSFRILLWGTIIFDVFLALNFFSQDGGWIAVINALSGIFFCIYLDTAIKTDKERETLNRQV